MNLKKVLSIVVSAAMLLGTMGTVAMAADMPDATVAVLPSTTLVADSYMAWPSGDENVNRPLNVVMNFQSQETPEEANKGGYADYLTDFYVTLTGLENGSIEADDCYLAGNYGDFGWVVIPMDDAIFENGVTYPIVAEYDDNITYRQICQSVKNFTAAIYVAPAIAQANPDMALTLELKMTNPDDENDVLTVGSYTYAGDELSASVAKIGDTEYMCIEDAVAAANDGDEIVLAKSVAVTNPIVIDKTITLDLGGNKITNMGSVYPVIRVQDDATLTISNGTVENTDDYVFVLGSSDSATSGNVVINGGTYKGMTTVASVTKGTLTINDGTFETFASEYGSTYLLNCVDANYNADMADIVVNGGKFVGFNPKSNAAEGKGTSFIADGYTTKLVNSTYVVEAVEEEVEVVAAENIKEDVVVSDVVLFEQTGVITEDDTEEITENAAPWCSYGFKVDGTFSKINVSVSKDGKAPVQIGGPKEANFDGTVMFGVVVTGLDSLDTITVDVQ